MSLATREKIPLFKQKVGDIIRQGVKFCQNQVLDVIFLLLIAMNFFVEMKLILVLFMLLYFTDRWQVFKQLINKNNDYAKIQEAHINNDPSHSHEPREEPGPVQGK